MKVECFASGSRGNAYRISDGVTTLLLEAGIPIRELERATGHTLSQADGCLISHEHSDHAKAARDLLRRAVDIYTSEGTAEALRLTGYRVHTLNGGEMTHIRTLDVLPFATDHDAVDPLGFLIRSTATRERLLFATDTAYIGFRFRDLNYALIEVNYDDQTARENREAGRLDDAQYARLMRTHMGLENAALFARDSLTFRPGAQFWAIHISTRNGNVGRIEQKMREALPPDVAFKICMEGYPNEQSDTDGTDNGGR